MREQGNRGGQLRGRVSRLEQTVREAEEAEEAGEKRGQGEMSTTQPQTPITKHQTPNPK
ncbi:hypothetical protein [Tolypothrix sp. PCC 7601]|uniref:hypothetical protein n=1 Tax=Tolypothrix sp. PCC 7601 TaxID=1188 RepID=UPI0005EAC70D|nr:hypothetical protein [Tolypothrix sp. PCC 7601]EKE99713.1 hypothetical protein FDUTEX481_09590 [Tolypothrix sp. PCC 7601]BAY91027.1 hypothetical protein NIES3275_30470 [Microchaete diplosiphon NIES-3275]